MTDQKRELRRCDAALTLAFSVLGKRWNGMIVGVLGGGPMAFAELRRAVDGISDAVLSDRLSELAGVELVVREVAPGPPVSVTYALTDSGARLLPVLDELGNWAAQNLAARTP